MEGEGIFYKLAFRYHFKPLAEPVAVMRDHASNMGKEVASNLQRALIWYEDLFAHPDFPPALQHLRSLAFGDSYRYAGWQAIRRDRDYRQGREWLRQAVACHPPIARNVRVRAGLLLASLPRPVSDACLALLNVVFGTPPPSPTGAATPVRAS
jgi:hypothetical protein